MMIYEYKVELDFISPEAAEPDWMQSEYDTFFIAVAVNIRFYLFSVSRIDDSFKMCIAHGVNRLEIENQLDIYAMAEEEMGFE